MRKSDGKFAYFPVNEPAIANGFYLTGAGMERIAPHAPYPLANHPEVYNFNWNLGRVLPEYQLVFVNDGSGIFESEATGVVRLESGSALILLPDVWHRYRPEPATGWSCDWISFNGNIPHLWQQGGALSPMRAVRKVPHLDRLSHSLHQIIESAMDCPENAESKSFSALASLAEFLADITDTGATSENSEEEVRLPIGRRSFDPLVKAALEIIWNHSHRGLSVVMIARQLNVTRRTLERHFKVAHDCSVLEEVLRCRLSRAKQMLTNTHLPIKRIAYASGFSSPTHMAIAFRRVLNTSPRKFRLAKFKSS